MTVCVELVELKTGTYVLANQGPNIANNWIWGMKHVFTIDFLFYWSLELHGFCPAIALMSQKVCAE